MADLLTTIGDMLGLNKGKATIDAANKNNMLLSDLEKQLGGIIDNNPAGGYLDQSHNLAALGPNANGLYGDALGINGADGTARAVGAFQTGPGYQFAMDQGLNALDRRAAARGQLNSGSTNLDTIRFAQGTADQEFQKWLDNLNTGINREVGTLGDLATFAGGQTDKRYGLAGDIGSGRLGVNQQIASGKEAGQGSLIDLFGNVAGIAGSFMGMNPGGGAAPAGGTSMPAGASRIGAGGTPAFAGYGRF